MIEEIEGIKVFIEPINDSVDEELSSSTRTGGLENTSFKPPEQVLNVIEKITKGFAKKVKNISQELAPDELEVELSIGFSKALNTWVFNAKGQGNLKVKMKWLKDTK